MRAITILLIAIAVLLSACTMLKTSRLEAAVLAALGHDSRTSSCQFEVSAQEDGTVLITGKLGTNAEYDAVSEIAKAVPGVTSVTNNCAVEEPSSGLLQDETVPSPFL